MQCILLNPFIVIVMVIVVVSSCHKSNHEGTREGSNDTSKIVSLFEFEYKSAPSELKQEWIVRLFSYFGIDNRLDPAEFENRLHFFSLTSSRNELWQYIISTEAFAEWLSRYFLYQLGFLDLRFSYPDHKIGSYYAIGGSLADYSNVLDAVNTAMEGKNFLKALMNNEGRVFLGPLVDQDHSRNVNMDNHVFPREVRRENVKILKQYLIHLKAKSEEVVWNQENECNAFLQTLHQVFNNLFIKQHIQSLLVRSLYPRRVNGNPVNSWGKFHEICILKPKNLDLFTIREAVSSSVNTLETFISYLESFEGSNYTIKNNPKSIRELDLVKFNLNHERESLYLYGVLKSLPNSLSNMNRKRAQWVYSQLLCERSLPVSLNHTSVEIADPHVSQNLCLSCHYKLDPTAGFFRHYGRWGIRFFEKEVITLDEGTNVSFDAYVSSWKYKDSLNVFFSQSPMESIEKFNSNRMNISQDLGDLFSQIINRPEFFRCLVQRMIEFVDLPNVDVDQISQNKLADKLFDLRDQNNNGLLIGLLDGVFYSPYFLREELQEIRCVNLSSRNPSEVFPPCEIREILKSNCESCHNLNLASGGLDISTIESKDGEASFLHYLKNGKKISSHESASSILNRITSNISSIKMPPKHSLSEIDQKKVQEWLKTWIAQSNE